MHTTTDGSSAAPCREPVHSGPDRRSVALLRRAQRADPATAEDLRDRVIRLNMPIARRLAARYRGRGIAREDLDQVAYLGLVKAVRGFRDDCGGGFLGYAVPTIRGELRRHFRDAGWSVRPPRRVQEVYVRALAVEPELAQQLGRPPDAVDLARGVGVSAAEVREALAAQGCFSPSSLDAPSDDRRGADLGDPQRAEDRGFEVAEARLVLGPALARLRPRDRRILELRFFAGLSQHEIGVRVGVTQAQVSRSMHRALAELREVLSDREAA